MSSLKKPINFEALENELDAALKTDELYKLQNDAKIRAIEQKVPTYDHFRNMVEAAHLRPLERSEMQKKPDVSWNHCVNKTEQIRLLSHPNTHLLYSKLNEGCDSIQPKTSTEFFKIFKHLPSSIVKFKFLLEYRNSVKDTFFKAEVPTELLEEFFKLSADICSEITLTDIMDLLEIFTECNRFSLSLAMISVSGKNNNQLLFDSLRGLVEKNNLTAESGKLNKLAQIYNVKM